MALLRRKRLVCFYCGHASSQKQDGTIREWLCKKCDAVNYLDESGEQAHPPPLERQTDARYAQSISVPRRSSPELSSSIEIPYCERCLRNHHFRKEALANYLPSDLAETDSEYQAFVSNYKFFLKELDDRYPQVCAKCEPRVRHILRTRHNAVKADNLRRNIDGSRDVRSRTKFAGWQAAVVLVGAVLYWSSIAIQLVWNIFGVLTAQPLATLLEANVSNLDIQARLQPILHLLHELEAYNACIGKAAGWGLVLGLGGLWWNPQLKHKVYWRRARMVGLAEYYRVQIIAIVARFVVWGILRDPETFGIKVAFHWIIHLPTFILTAAISYWATRLVSIDTTPLISWKESPQSLLSKEGPELPPNLKETLGKPPSYGRVSPLRPQRDFQRFPTEKIVSTPKQEPWQKTSVQEYDDDDDAMDWSPSYSLLLNNRPSETVLGSHPTSSKTNVGVSDLKEFLPRNKYRRPPGLDDTPQSQIRPPNEYPPMEESKLAVSADTGLEDIFTSFFSIDKNGGDSEGSYRRATPPAFTFEPVRASKNLYGRILSILLLGSCSFAWHQGHFPGQVELVSLGLVAVFSGLSLLGTLMTTGSYRSYSNLLVFFAELLTSVLLGQVQYGQAHLGTWDTSGKVLLGVVILQELKQLVDCLRAPGQHLGTSLSPQRNRSPPQKSQSSGNALVPTSQESNIAAPAHQYQPSHLSSNSWSQNSLNRGPISKSFGQQSSQTTYSQRSYTDGLGRLSSQNNYSQGSYNNGYDSESLPNSFSSQTLSQPVSKPKLLPHLGYNAPPPQKPFWDANKPPSFNSRDRHLGADRQKLFQSSRKPTMENSFQDLATELDSLDYSPPPSPIPWR